MVLGRFSPGLLLVLWLSFHDPVLHVVVLWWLPLGFGLIYILILFLVLKDPLLREVKRDRLGRKYVHTDSDYK